MKRPHGFETAIELANYDDGFANISISKELILELDNYICQLEVKCDATQPRKTVSDAVDYYDGFWPHEIRNVLSWCSKERLWFFGMPINGQYKVCTREEFEAEVERRKGEEWTHVDLEGDKCKVIHTHDDYVWVQYDSGKHSVYKSKFISKRKPSISKAEAWRKLVKKNRGPRRKVCV